jgi:hypothetical protein
VFPTLFNRLRYRPAPPMRVSDAVFFDREFDRGVTVGCRPRGDDVTLLSDFDDAPASEQLRFFHCRLRRQIDRAGGLRTILKPRLSTILPRTAIGT